MSFRLIVLFIVHLMLFNGCEESPTNSNNNPEPDVYGCTDSNAINYNPSATIDNGSCEYESLLPANCVLGEVYMYKEYNQGNPNLWGIRFSAEVSNIGEETANNVVLQICGMSICTQNNLQDCYENYGGTTINGGSTTIIEFTTPDTWFHQYDGCGGSLPSFSYLYYNLNWN